MIPAMSRFASKPPRVEHLAELLTDLSFIISERGSQQLSAAAVPLLFGWKIPGMSTKLSS